jgi:hypothetical protein
MWSPKTAGSETSPAAIGAVAMPQNAAAHQITNRRFAQHRRIINLQSPTESAHTLLMSN